MTENANTLNWKNPKLSNEQQIVLGDENHFFGLDEIAVGASPEQGGIAKNLQSLVNMAGGVQTPDVAYHLSQLAQTEEGEIWDTYHKEIALKIDSLTGLPNRQLFYEEAVPLLRSLAHLIPVDEQPKKVIAVMLFLDVNNLKVTNDTKGHAEGDKLIVSSVDVLRKTFDGLGIFGKFGGDEFAGLIPIHDRDEIEPIAQQLKQNMKGVAASVGLVPFTAEKALKVCDGNQQEVLGKMFYEADILMYRAKDNPSRTKEVGSICFTTNSNTLAVDDNDLSWVADAQIIEAV